MNVRTFLFDSAYQLITWVFIAISIGGIYHFASKGNLRGVVWSVVILLGSIIVMLGLLADRYIVAERIASAQQKPLFSVVAEQTIRVTTRPKEPETAAFAVLFPYLDEILMAPITDMIYVRFTNNNTKPIMIDAYAVDIRNPSGTWRKSPSLERKLSQQGQLILITRQRVSGVTLDAPTLDRAVKDVSIISGGMVKGWLFIERPIGFDGKTEFRLRIEVNGRWGAAVIAPSPVSDHKFTETLIETGFKMSDPGPDLTHVRAMYYSDLLKQIGNE